MKQQEMYTRIIPLVEEIKKRYPKELNIEGLEPALTNDIAEICLIIEKEMVERVRGVVEGMKFPEIKGGSKEMPHSEFPTAKPAHESNEVLMQYSYNQALDDLLSSLDKPTDK